MSTEPAAAKEGDLLFEPSPERVERSNMRAFMRSLADASLRESPDYRTLWQWSIDELESFWRELAGFSGVRWRVPPAEGDTSVLVRANGAEGARFFPGAELNYVDQVRRHPPDRLAVITADESGARGFFSYGEVSDLAERLGAGLRAAGVGAGDRVAAVLPNGLAAVVGFLATASLGAIWSSCAPEFGAASMIDRFQQIGPKALLVAEGYWYGGRGFDLAEKRKALEGALGDLVASVSVPASWPGGSARGSGRESAGSGRASAGRLRRYTIDDLITGSNSLESVSVEFSHPLWILYSSGTTGLPKAIVHSHGGIVLEHLKAVGLHCDLGEDDRFFWFSTTGWMMWNFLLGGLLAGTTIVCYDGSPVHPDPMALWRLAAELRITFFGTSGPFIESCRKSGLSPRSQLDLSAIHSVGSTGAPLPPEGFAWATREIADDVLVGSVSGGTDVCTAFLANCPLLPVHAGELQCSALGAAVRAFRPDGKRVVGEVGELVVTEPMVSMPVRLWDDPDGSRLHASYFSEYPGVWRHGDWVKETERGTFVIYGRSDATLNRGGVRMGTAEFYRVVERIDGISDSLVIDTSELGREGELILLVVAADCGQAGTSETGAELEMRIRKALKEELSPRHVPDRIVPVRTLPRTLNGKKVEVPIRKVVLGADPESAVSRDSLQDPSAFDAVLAALREAGVRTTS